MLRCNKLKFLMISHLVQRSLKQLALCPLGINSVNLENLQNSDGISTQNTQVGSSVLHKDQGTSQGKQAQFFRQKNKGVQSNPVPSGNEESRGYAFLIQVKCFDNIK